jgi:peptidoglycan L-alanyl-D-glutamate endopeptidase CwlK
MPFTFGSTSLKQIEKLHPALVKVITEALAVSPVDYGVLRLGGARTADEQHDLWLQGRFGHPGKIVTQLDGHNKPSNHQIKADGFGHAVDLVPFAGGKPTWNWELIYPMISAVAKIAKSQGTSLRWGGVWDRKLEELKADDLEAEVAAYCKRHPGPDHIDGPHLEYLGAIKKEVKK